MKKLLGIGGAFMLLITSISGCDNTVDVNAPWEEITIVYGLLDPRDTTHYLKINKAFLNKNKDAETIARRNPDSLYHNHNIRARLQEINNGQVQKSVALEKVRLKTKEPGLFPHPGNMMYKGKMVLNPENRYKLVIDSLKDQNQVTAQTPVLGKLILRSPTSQFPRAPNTFSFAETGEITFDGRTGKHAFFYKFQMNMIYKNINKNTGKSYWDTTEWVFFPEKNTRQTDREDFEYRLPSDQFFEMVSSRLASDKAIKRPISDLKVKLIVTGGAEEIFNYLEVNKPSTSIVQKKPEYTNINNGRGIFSSRRKTKYDFQFSEGTKDSLQRIDQLKFTP